MPVGVRIALISAVLLLFGIATLWSLADDSDRAGYPYSQLLSDAAAGRVEAITQEGTLLTVTLSGEAQARQVRIASESINVYGEVCQAADAEVGECPIDYEVTAGSASGQWLGLLISSLLPVLLIGAFIFFMMRYAQRRGPGA